MKLKGDDGQEYDFDDGIFPIISEDVRKSTAGFLGTGFFIQGAGVFVTAKHVVVDRSGNVRNSLYAVQKTEIGPVIRPISYINLHSCADIAVGFLGQVLGISGDPLWVPIAPSFVLSTERLLAGAQICTFAYPTVISEDIDYDKIRFNFTGRYNTGNIIDYHDRFLSLPNRCYSTTVKVSSGASGGPVLTNKYVVGVNSIGMDVEEGEEPLSTITTIDYLMDLFLPVTKQ